jgi:lipoprotein-anchoring transpeptidase ErfK/SrfK
MRSTRPSLPLLLAAGMSFIAADFAAAQNWLFFDRPHRPAVQAQPYAQPPVQREWMVPPQYHRQIVPLPTSEAPGTIIVDTPNKFLYYVLPGGEAIRYGIGVGREGFGWTGVTTVGRKAEWPDWTPPATMIKRQPELAKYASGMPGGPDNPLGARALYLYQGGKDTLFRIHGTNEIWSIGQSRSSGCIRMMNHDVIELYHLTKVGTKVIVR